MDGDENPWPSALVKVASILAGAGIFIALLLTHQTEHILTWAGGWILLGLVVVVSAL